MKLSELTEDTQIQLEFVVGKEKLYLDGKISQVSKSGLVLFPVKIDGKSLSFKNNSHAVNLVAIQTDGKPLRWKNVMVTNAVISGKQYVLVKSLADGAEYNRRHNYRLALDIKGTIVGGDEVIIHDISNGGVSFYTPKAAKRMGNGSVVKLGFVARNQTYVITATIARCVEEEERVLYGCTMPSTPYIDQFITEEQRIRIKGY